MWAERRRAKLRHDAPLNIVWDGNSLAAGYGGTPPALLVQRMLRAMGRDVVTATVAIVGQTWRQMDGLDGGSAADVDAAYFPGRTNILMAWETTNAIYQAGRMPAQAAGDAAAYLRNRLAVHPDWRAIVLTSLPRHEGADAEQLVRVNAALEAADAIMRRDWRAWGARALVDVRCPGSPFRFAAYRTEAFAKDAQLWADRYVHLSDAGDQVIAAMATRAIVALGAR